METILQWDGGILLWIQETLRTDWLTPVMKAVTFLGDSGWFWIVLALALCCFRPTRRAGVAAAIALLLSLLVNNICLKPLIDRIRPYELVEGLICLVSPPGDASFPSGHAGASFAAAAAMFPYLRRRWGVCLLVLAGLIALSRLYVGVHYPTDVMFGALSGIIIGVIVCRVWDRMAGKENERDVRRTDRE